MPPGEECSEPQHDRFVLILMSVQTILHIGWLAAVAIQVLMPAILMGVRWCWPKLMPVWAIIVILVFGGWVIANVQVHMLGMYLTEIITHMQDPDPSDSVVDHWQADGARLVFALVFGWAYGPVLWVLWSPVFAMAWVVRKFRTSSHTSSALG